MNIALPVKRKPRAVVEHLTNNKIRLKHKKYLAFTHNDYLGVSADSRVLDSCTKVIKKYGVSSKSSNIVTGYQSFIEDLEYRISEFLGYQRCLIFSCGYMANLSIMQGLLKREDIIIQDRDNHASLIDASVLSRAKLLRYKHLNYKDLEDLCYKHENAKMIVTESVFSMSGEIADINRIVKIKQHHCRGAKVFVDDTHGMCVLGNMGAGILEDQNLSTEDVDILSFGLGKGFGAQGGVVASCQEIINRLIDKSRTYRYSTAIPPVLIAAIDKSLQIIKKELWRRDLLQEKIAFFRKLAKNLDLNLSKSRTPIQTLEYSDEGMGIKIYEHLKENGILVHPVVRPTVPPGVSRIRIIINVNHSKENIENLIIKIKEYEKIAL